LALAKPPGIWASLISMSEYQSRDCPGCGYATGDVPIVIRSARPAEALSFEELTDYWRGFRKDNVFFSYGRCPRCGLLFCPVYFSSEQLTSLYGSMEDNTAGERIDHLARTQRGYVKQAARCVPVQGMWLDLGADIGLCATALRTQPTVDAVDAIEPNGDVHHQLRMNVGTAGSVYRDWSEVGERVYDGIMAIHVLDHLLDLSNELASISSHLKTGGSLAVVVHNEKSLLRRLLGTRWPPICLQHPQIFSSRTLEAALSSHGYSLVKIARTVNWFSVQHVAKVGFQIMGISGRLSRVIPAVPLPLRLGNIVALAVKN